MVLAELAKEFDAGILTVAGELHATVEPEQCLNHCDIVMRGEGEKRFYEILQGHDLDAIQGVSYRKHGKMSTG